MRKNNDNKNKRTPYYLWGHHAVLSALRNPKRLIKKLYLTEKNKLYMDQLNVLSNHPVKILHLNDIDKLFQQQIVTHQGFVLETQPLQKKDLNQIINSKLLVALDQVTDPQNIGAIMRSSKVFGSSCLITTKRNSPGETGALAKAASGALEYIDIIEVTNLAATLTLLSKKGFIIIGLDEMGESKMSDIKLDDDQPRVLVMGSEGKGLRRLTKTKCDIMAVIENKTNDEFSTLNVSASAAISLYQLSISN
jgi:23S rRNA (guanosine2251-2'-O)-methyltransferase